jgi:hypothetical protein
MLRIRIVPVIILILSFFELALGQETKWSYQKEKNTYFPRNPRTIFTISKIENKQLIEKHIYKTSGLNDSIISFASFYTPNNIGTKEIEYIWAPSYGLIYLAKVSYYSNVFDSTYYFYEDGMNIKAITYSERMNKPELRFKLGERYFFDFPSPKPDTLPAFFEKVKAGCPYTPCTVISVE